MTEYLIRLARLQDLARSWGGGIVELLEDDKLWEADHINASPFSFKLGLDHAHKTIYILEGAELGGIIHEMGHVFASAAEPSRSVEYEFFGWEFVVAAKIGIVEEWIESVGDYTVGGDHNAGIVDFKDMTIDEQSDLIEERVQHARTLGLVIGEEPIAIR
jgi:hypothetical protein